MPTKGEKILAMAGKINSGHVTVLTTERIYLRTHEQLAKEWDDNQQFIRPAMLAEEETNYGGF